MVRRRKITPEQKAAILREHLLDHVSVADLCDKHGINPNLFYRWQKEAFENLPAVFTKKNESTSKSLERENKALREKCASREQVIAEIMEDLISTKKRNGDLL